MPEPTSRDDQNLWTVISEARAEIVKVDTRTSIHEAVCAERYREINSKLKWLLWGGVILFVAQLFGVDKAVKAMLHLAGVSP